MDNTKALQNLLKDEATQEQIKQLNQALASGEISIGGNVNQSVIILGNGNTVEITSETLDRLGARPMLGNLERDLNGNEMALGLQRLEAELSLRAPVLMSRLQEQTRRLRPTLKTKPNMLSETARKERLETLAHINSLCMEALDISFNAVATGEAVPEYEARCPFRGLESFRVEDCEFFFGREELTKKLVGKIKAHSFLAVLGASGSGKSSLVMAGMIPALDLDYAIIRPGTNPLETLESARGKSLLVVDQFEELFTLTRDGKTRADFISTLLASTKSGRVIITLRSDFLGEAGAYRSLSGEIQNHLAIIPPMNADELCRAMDGQARWAQLEFEADLSQQILDDVAGEPGAMPLLQHALWELWNRRHGRHLRASEYRAFGGVRQAITSTAEKVYDHCSKTEQEQLRDIFLRLTRLDEGDEGRDTRRRVSLGDLVPSGADAASISALLDKLANARLIVKTINDKAEIEVAHEALIRHWERLRIWLNEDRDNLHLRESVSESAKEWEKSGKHESLLNSRWTKLDEALLLIQNSRYRLTEPEQTYLKSCVSLRNKEQRERERRLRYTVFASIAAAFIFVVLGSFGVVKSNEAASQAATAQSASTLAFDNAATAQSNENTAVNAQAKAEEQANIALARQLAAQAHLLNIDRSSSQMIASLLAIESMELSANGESARFLLNNNYAAPPIAQISHAPNYLGYGVSSVAFSPDGKYVVSGYSDGTADVWESTTGKEIAHLTHGWINIEVVIFSPDGKYVASGGLDGTIIIWEANTGREISRMIHSTHVASITFNRDGKYIASGSWDGTACVWEVVTGKKIACMNHDEYVNSVAFSPHDKCVISGSDDGTVRVWEAFTGKEIARMTHDKDVNSVAFSPHDKYMISGSTDNTARVWEVATGKEIARMTHNNSVYSTAFSADGKYVVSGSADDTARVWEAFTGKEIARMAHDHNVNSVAFSPDGMYVISGSDDYTARVWETFTGKEIARMTHNDIVTTVAFSPDSKHVVSGSDDGTARVWEVAHKNGDIRMAHNDIVASVAFNLDGKYITSGSYDDTARVWDAATGKEIARMTHEKDVNSLAFSPDGKYVVSGSDDHTARVWEAATGKEISRMTHDNSVWRVAFSPDGKYVVSGSTDDTARVWEAATGKEVTRMTHDSSVCSVAFSPNGQYAVSGSIDDTARVWEVATGKEVARMPHDDNVGTVAFSPDGKYVVSGSDDHSARVWEATTGKEVTRMSHDSAVEVVTFSPDGKYVASGGLEGIARVWEATTGKEISRMTYELGASSVAFSPDSKYVVSGGADGTARVWEAKSGVEITRMIHDDEITAVSFSPDGKLVISASRDHTLHVWIWQSSDLTQNACKVMPRNLTRIEWTQYIGDALPYQAVCSNLPIEPEFTPTP